MGWLEYVEAAAVAQRLDHASGPLVLRKGEPVRFNPAWSYCADCSVEHRTAMLKRDRCDPCFVRKQLEAAAEEQA